MKVKTIKLLKHCVGVMVEESHGNSLMQPACARVSFQIFDVVPVDLAVTSLYPVE